MLLSEITPLVLTFNEAPNIGRVLDKLSWATEILVVDSFSTDETMDIVRSVPQTRVVQRTFDTFAGQCNFGLAQVRSPWVLSLDADYVLSNDFISEVEALASDEDIRGYRATFVYCIAGRPLRASLYPARTVLYRKANARYVDEGHGHRVQVDGRVSSLQAAIYHDDRKPFVRWLTEQNKYMIKESQTLLATARRDLTLSDRLRRRIVLAPPLVFLYTLIGQGLILDGWRGWFYVYQRTIAELMLSIRLVERRLQATLSEADRDS